MDAVFEQIKEKALADTQALHDLSGAFKKASGTIDEKRKWIDESDNEVVVTKREQIKRGLAKIAELKAELEAMAEEALVPEGYDPNEVASEFKERKKNTRAFLLQSKGVFEQLGADADSIAELQELFDNLPTISGGITASGKSPAELSEARAWLKEQGEEVADKGRIAKDLLAKWDAHKAA
jgi:hypothetical protein